MTGVLTVSSPRTLAQGRKLISGGATWTEALQWLDGLPA
jgi:hypothetical protein